MLYAVKAVGDWELDVLGVPYGGPDNRDADGEYFAADTKFHADKFALPPAVYYHGYEDKGKPSGSPAYIGKAVSREARNDGVWFRVVLDKASEYARRVWEAAKQGTAYASSGSVGHLVRKARDGKILEWPVAELSIFDTANGKQPANRYAVALPVMKMMYSRAGISLPADIEPEPEANVEGGPDGAAKANAADGTQTNKQSNTKGDVAMTPEEITKLVADTVAAERKKLEEEAATKAAQDKAVNDAVAAAKAAWEKEQAANNRLPSDGGVAPYAMKFAELRKYDNLDAADMAYTVQMLQSGKLTGRGNGPTQNAMKAILIKVAEEKSPHSEAGRQFAKAYGLDLNNTQDAIKANELNYSTQAGFGDEFVSIVYSNRLWEAVRAGTFVVPKLESMALRVDIPRGAEAVILPVEGADPTFYAVGQTTDTNATTGIPNATVTTSKVGTAPRTLPVAKIGGRALYSGELDEDSIIPWASYLRGKLETGAAEQLEHAIIDGDTTLTANTNINAIGAAQVPPAGAVYTLFDGFRKLALVTNTANSRSASGAIADTDFLETLKLMGTAGLNGADANKTSFVIDGNVQWKILTLASVKTRDLFQNATLENGFLRAIWGYTVNTSYFMHYKQAARKANAAGKIDTATDANNTLGSILAVRWDQWAFGYGRRMTMELVRRAESDSYDVVALMRVGLQYRDTEASAISYNVLV